MCICTRFVAHAIVVLGLFLPLNARSQATQPDSSNSNGGAAQPPTSDPKQIHAASDAIAQATIIDLLSDTDAISTEATQNCKDSVAACYDQIQSSDATPPKGK